MSSLRCLAQRNEVINHVGIVRMSPWLNGKFLFVYCGRAKLITGHGPMRAAAATVQLLRHGVGQHAADSTEAAAVTLDISRVSLDTIVYDFHVIWETKPQKTDY